MLHQSFGCTGKVEPRHGHRTEYHGGRGWKNVFLNNPDPVPIGQLHDRF
jgi:hypothetical protein